MIKKFNEFINEERQSFEYKLKTILNMVVEFISIDDTEKKKRYLEAKNISQVITIESDLHNVSKAIESMLSSEMDISDVINVKGFDFEKPELYKILKDHNGKILVFDGSMFSKEHMAELMMAANKHFGIGQIKDENGNLSDFTGIILFISSPRYIDQIFSEPLKKLCTRIKQ